MRTSTADNFTNLELMFERVWEGTNKETQNLLRDNISLSLSAANLKLTERQLRLSFEPFDVYAQKAVAFATAAIMRRCINLSQDVQVIDLAMQVQWEEHTT